MGFALPTLSFLRLAVGIRLPALCAQTETQSGLRAPPSQSYVVLTLNKSRSRGRRRGRSSTGAATNAQMPLPLQLAKEEPAPAALRIIQHAPQERPECLFISGRMADVCAALERMEARESHRDS